MTSVKATVCGLLLAVGLTGSALAGVIADFSGDYVAGTVVDQTRASASADGWDYLWNATGPIGTAANYSSLLWVGDYRYTAYGPAWPVDDGSGFMQLGEGWGHPGRPAGTPTGNAWARFAIAAYTIQANVGPVNIIDSSILASSSFSDGVELRVYVNDSLKTSFIQAGGSPAAAFNISLGSLNTGDKVYVAVGANNSDANDTFNLSYKLVPEPATLVLLALGGLLAGAGRRRR